MLYDAFESSENDNFVEKILCASRNLVFETFIPSAVVKVCKIEVKKAKSFRLISP